MQVQKRISAYSLRLATVSHVHLYFTQRGYYLTFAISSQTGCRTHWLFVAHEWIVGLSQK